MTTRMGSALEVFLAALVLGMTSFGGPVAHIGYFERSYVHRRRWLSADAFAGLVSLCQLLPGPGSSQLGFLIGHHRAGWAGAFAAWFGFTLPSALLMFGLAFVTPRLSGAPAAAAMHALMLVAVPVVAQAVWSMAKNLCPDPSRAAIATAATLLLLAGRPGWQMPVMLAGAFAGAVLCRRIAVPMARPRAMIGRRAGVSALVLFATLLLLLPLAASAPPHGLVALVASFYRTGALVFGGGHVVLPLLRAALVPRHWLSDGSYLAGYGAAQALPGPMFAFAAYLGAAASPGGLATRVLWSGAALVALFLPGLLIAIAGIPLLSWLDRHPLGRGAWAGTNAVVVGILAAALYDPICKTALHGLRDAAIALLGLILLMRLRVPPVAVVAATLACTLAMASPRAIRASSPPPPSPGAAAGP
ncbi:MAG: chromate efflux transporter [Sphingomonadales bacterium]|nr:chromate efflux transporter [Sphingomonadales bacterium]